MLLLAFLQCHADMDTAAGQILYPLHRCKTLHLVRCNFILTTVFWLEVVLSHVINLFFIVCEMNPKA